MSDHALCALDTYRLHFSLARFQKICNGSDSKTASFSNKTELEQQFLQFVLELWFPVEESAHANGAVREPREATIDVRDPLGRSSLSYFFVCTIVRTKFENGP